MAKDFYVPGFHLSYIPFLYFVDGKKEPERLKVLLFYVHHAQFIDEINPKLEVAKCRPMAANELKELFRMQEGILDQIEFEWIIATGPEAVEEVQGGGKIITAIRSDEDRRLGICDVRMQSPLLVDHAGIYVAAVKKE